jgi:hypothetical protein
MDDQLDVMLWILLLQLPSDVKAQRAGAFCDDDDSELYRAVSSGAQLLDMGRLIKNDVNSVKHVKMRYTSVYQYTIGPYPENGNSNWFDNKTKNHQKPVNIGL